MDEHELGDNAILGALPEREQERIRPHLQMRNLERGDALYQPGDPLDAVYFPFDAVLSMLQQMGDGTSVEAATIGYEGMGGLPAFLGVSSSPHALYCQITGQAARLEVPALHEVLRDDGALHEQLHHYTSAMMVQMAQNVACNSTHSAEQRAARWLLTTQDRVRRDEFSLTQEFLAQMLAVRRPTVSEIAGRLQQQGLIRYVRGHITVLDRARLEALACSCYRIVREAFPRLDADSARRDRGVTSTGSPSTDDARSDQLWSP